MLSNILAAEAIVKHDSCFRNKVGVFGFTFWAGNSIIKPMKLRGIILAVSLVLFLLAPARAEISLKAEVDKASIKKHEALTYKLTISSSEKNIPSPQLPKFEGFRIISQGQSSRLSFTKGQAERTIVYAFILVPVEAGRLKIEASSLKIKGQTILTDSFEIEVSLDAVKPQPKPEEQPSLPKEIPSEEQEQSQITL